MRIKLLVAFLFVFLISNQARAVYTAARAYVYDQKPPEWFATDEAKQIATNILSYQSALGGFPKNVDTAGGVYKGDPKDIEPTFDNSATTDELRYLARMFDATKDDQYKQAFSKGLDYILKAQYPTGGWPQSYPPGHANYDHYITFNDGAMARLMIFLREVGRDEPYTFVDADKRKACLAAWDKGIDCILKCQIKVDGKLTAWCAQHDEKDFSPRPARTFEPISISGCETVGICHVLMKDEKPSPEVIRSVDAAVAWLDSVKILGIKLEDRKQEGTPKGFERFVVEDPSAPPLWARFYEIGTNKPIYSGRDSSIKYKLSEIEIERRTGYQWLKDWPKNLIEKEYPKWKKTVGNAS